MKEALELAPKQPVEGKFIFLRAGDNGLFAKEGEKLQMAGLLLNAVNAIRYISVSLQKDFSGWENMSDDVFKVKTEAAQGQINDISILQDNLFSLAGRQIDGKVDYQDESVKKGIGLILNKYKAAKPTYKEYEVLEVKTFEDLDQIFFGIQSLHHDFKNSFNGVTAELYILGRNDFDQNSKGAFVRRLASLTAFMYGVDGATLQKKEKVEDPFVTLGEAKGIMDAALFLKLVESFGSRPGDVIKALKYINSINRIRNQDQLLMFPVAWFRRLADNVASDVIEALEREEAENPKRRKSSRKIQVEYSDYFGFHIF